MVSDEMREGSGLFSALAHLPVQASFGFVDDMRRRSSGAASASLMLSHWERLPVSASSDSESRGHQAHVRFSGCELEGSLCV